VGTSLELQKAEQRVVYNLELELEELLLVA
jgi:hypothetical protein